MLTLKYEDLKSIINLENDSELHLVNNDWFLAEGCNHVIGEWLSKGDFLKLFSDLSQYVENEKIYVFETFERIYKSNGIAKRLCADFNFNWDDFSKFQNSSDMISFYLVPNDLSWVFYVNDDYWAFRKATNKPFKQDF
jgi:hypothetical protein